MGEIGFRLYAGPAGASSLSALPEAAASAIQRVELEEARDLSTIVRVRFAVAVAPGGDRWTILDDDTFGRLSRLRVVVTVGDGAPEVLVDAHVVEVHAELSGEPGKSTLEVIGLDSLVLLSLEEKIRTFPGASDSGIAQSILSEHGLQVDVTSVDRTPTEEQWTPTQRGTDLDFLRWLARKNGFELRCRSAGGADENASPAQVRFGPPTFEPILPKVLTVGAGGVGNVERFSLRFRPLRSAQVVVRAQDGAHAPVEQTVATSGQQLLGAERPSGEPPRKVLPAEGAVFSTDEVEPFARGLSDELDHVLFAEGELKTAAYEGILRAGAVVAVRGIGTRFSGHWQVDRVLHTIEPGSSYSQRFRLRRNGTGQSGSEDFGGGS